MQARGIKNIPTFPISYSTQYVQPATRQLRLSFLVRLARLFAQQIIDPLPVWFDLLTTGIHNGQVEPRGCIADCADLIRDVFTRETRHRVVEFLIRVEVIKVARDLDIVADIAEIARLAMLNLQRYATCTRGDDRLACVQSLGNFDFKPFTCRQLQRDL